MTTVEIETKKTTLETEMSTALTAAQALTPATPEFDDAYGRYLKSKADLAKIPEELAKAKLAENSEAIAVAGGQVSEAITQLIAGLKVEELLGTPVISLRFAIDSEGKALTVFNPVTKVASTRKAGEAKSAGRTSIVDSEGNKFSLTKFVLAHATTEEKDSKSDKFLKYPHVAVDTKPKFDAFCEAHSLIGFVYTLPETNEAS